MRPEQTHSDDSPGGDWHSTPTAPDPAALAADILIERAVELQSNIAAMTNPSTSIVVVQIPSRKWADLICSAWLKHFFHEVIIEVTPRRFRHHEDCLAISKFGKRVEYIDITNTDVVSECIWRGLQIIVFSEKTRGDLFSDFQVFVDCVYHIPPFTAADMHSLTRQLMGSKPNNDLPSENAANITPMMLRLARRPDQTADSYIHKLLQATSASVGTRQGSSSPRVTPSLHRLHGMDEAVKWGLRLARDIADFKMGKLDWRDVDGGCLLSGPPGVGKTLFARALSTTCDVPLITGSYGVWHSTGGTHQGSFLSAMRKAFSDAKKKNPSILFIDEIDSFPNRATVKHDWSDYEMQIVNALLAEIDGVAGRDGVILLGACNHPDKLDPALIRSGRLDRHIAITLPDTTALEKILREHLASDLNSEDLNAVALAATGSSGADCERYVRGARRQARINSRPMVLDDLAAEIGGGDERSEGDLLRAAIHEAGHAYALVKLKAGRLNAVSIHRGGAVGGIVTSSYPETLLSEAEVKDRLIIALCGRAAEQVFYGSPSSGSGGSVDSDLAVATRWATTTVASLGFSQKLGLLWRGLPDENNLATMLTGNPTLAAVVKDDLEVAYQNALSLIANGQEPVMALARALVEHRALNGKDVASILAQHLSKM